MLGKDGVGKRSVTWRVGARLPMCLLLRNAHFNHQLYSNKFVIMLGYDPTDSSDFALDVNVEGKHVQYDGEHQSPHLGWSPGSCPADIKITYYIMRHCEVCLYVYDVSDRSSFEAVKTYHELFFLERSLERSSCFQSCSPSCLPRPPYRGLNFVIANKIDCEEEDWAVSRDEGEAFSASIGGTFIPMSAKTGEGAYDDLLADMTRLVLLRRVYYMVSRQPEQSLEARAAADLHAAHHDNRMFWY